MASISVEERCGKARGQCPHAIAAREQRAERQSLLAGGARERDVRIEIGGGDAHLRGRRMQLGFGGEDIGALVHELGGQTHGQGARQLEPAEVQIRRRPVRGRAADEDGERMARNRKLLGSRGQQGLVIGELAVCKQHVDARRIAGGERGLHEVEVAPVLLEELVDRTHALGGGGERNRLAGDVAGERELRGAQLLALVLKERAALFDRARDAARGVERIAHRCTGGKIGEGRRRREGTQELFPVFLPSGARGEVDARVARAGGGRREFLRLLQRALRRMHGGTCGERLVNEFIQGVGTKQSPPVRRHGRTQYDSLRAVRSAGARGRRGRGFSVALRERRGGSHEVRPGRTAAQQEQ
jgi:hypothetical protein